MEADRGDSGLQWEVIVVDDASPDGTQEVAKQLAKLYGEDHVVCPQLKSSSIVPECVELELIWY